MLTINVLAVTVRDPKSLRTNEKIPWAQIWNVKCFFWFYRNTQRKVLRSWLLLLILFICTCFKILNGNWFFLNVVINMVVLISHNKCYLGKQWLLRNDNTFYFSLAKIQNWILNCSICIARYYCCPASAKHLTYRIVCRLTTPVNNIWPFIDIYNI